MTIQETLEQIYKLHQFNVKLGLDSITALLNHLGNPEKSLKIIHVAGSNGKGSTSSFLASLLHEQGYRVGLYTSPHFVRFNERIRISGNEIDDKFIINFMEPLADYIKENVPTFFEITTALAYKYFSEKDVDVVIMETGLGGRLDATNTITPLASIITSISLEHTNILGNSLKEIAGEKAGIIKQDNCCIIGKLPEEAKCEIKRISHERNAEFVNLEDYLNAEKNILDISFQNIKLCIDQTPLSGIHQNYNAALAVLSLEKIGLIKDYTLISKGISNVIVNTGFQGRYEVYSNSPKIIFDAAHNLEGVEVFLKTFEKEASHYDKRKIIFGAMQDKDLRSMMSLLKNYFNKFYFYTINYERATSLKELEIIAEEMNIDSENIKDPELYIEEFRRKNGNKCLVVLGSIYMLGEIKSKLLNN